jgi:hypothetical protein
MSERGQKLARYVDEIGKLRAENARLKERAATPTAEAFAAIAALVEQDAADPKAVVFAVATLFRRHSELARRLGEREARLEQVRRAAAGELPLNGAGHG